MSRAVRLLLGARVIRKHSVGWTAVSCIQRLSGAITWQWHVALLRGKHSFIEEVRGRGLMIGIEFHEPREFKLKMAWKLLHKIDKVLFAQMIVTQMLSKHRILTQVAGHAMDVLKILPPLIIGEKEVDMFVNALDY